MLRVSDTVKVISAPKSHWDPEDRTEYIPIGTRCNSKRWMAFRVKWIFYICYAGFAGYMVCASNKTERDCRLFI